MQVGLTAQRLAKQLIWEYDHNRDGVLDRSETRMMLEDALRALGTPVINDPLLDRLVAALDIEEDGLFTEASVLPVLTKILERLLRL